MEVEWTLGYALSEVKFLDDSTMEDVVELIEEAEADSELLYTLENNYLAQVVDDHVVEVIEELLDSPHDFVGGNKNGANSLEEPPPAISKDVFSNEFDSETVTIGTESAESNSFNDEVSRSTSSNDRQEIPSTVSFGAPSSTDGDNAVKEKPVLNISQGSRVGVFLQTLRRKFSPTALTIMVLAIGIFFNFLGKLLR